MLWLSAVCGSSNRSACRVPLRAVQQQRRWRHVRAHARTNTAGRRMPVIQVVNWDASSADHTRAASETGMHTRAQPVARPHTYPFKHGRRARQAADGAASKKCFAADCFHTKGRERGAAGGAPQECGPQCPSSSQSSQHLCSQHLSCGMQDPPETMCLPPGTGGAGYVHVHVHGCHV